MISIKNVTRYVGVCGLLLLAAGCSSKNKPSKANFASAIDSYYSAHPDCLWSSPVKFPMQTDPSKQSETAGLDALTDAGMLTRTAEQKREFIFGSKQVNDYDLSDKGRSQWIPDQQQPGFGNFCFGHRDVTSIDNFSTSGDAQGATIANVDYHFKITGAPAWAENTEMKTAFPTMAADLDGTQVDKAALVLTRDDGWQVSKD